MPGTMEADAAASLRVLLVLLAAAVMVSVVESATDSSDVQALGVLYGSLNSPPQLTGWSSSGGDPCGSSWKGISCSGSAVTAIQLSGLGLNGTLGYLLSDLTSLKTLDLSNNNIHDTIPYQLPPNLTYLNLANNNISGNLQYSMSSMVSLNYLNISHNILSQSIQDDFKNLQGLSELDLSFNNFTGDLPNSFGSLSNLSSLYLQSNQLTGSVNILASLDLTTLDISNNQFSGWIPKEFDSIPNLLIGGNSFTTGPAPPPPPYMPPPPRKTRSNHTPTPSGAPAGSGGKLSPTNKSDNKSLSTSAVIGIIVGSIACALCVALAIVLCIRVARKQKDNGVSNKNDSARSVVIDNDKGEGLSKRMSREDAHLGFFHSRKFSKFSFRNWCHTTL